jgi:predicted nucleic acid-binding protein
LSLLIRVGQAEVLPRLFRHVAIPPEVASEMSHPKAPIEVRQFIAAAPAWLSVRAATMPLLLPHLDPGESEAISLAAELGAALLIDERDGRNEAQARGLVVIGALGVLERAANLGLIADLAAVHAIIRQSRFHVSEILLQASLARHLAIARGTV